MRLLSVPQWSFGRDRALLREFADILDVFHLRVHYLVSDPDHNRTVSAFSGDASAVFEALERLCVAALPRIDLTRHTGVFPRIGALDVCPIVDLGESGETPTMLARYIDQLAWTLADFYQLPVFLYERSERDRPEGELAELRRGGFGTLLDRELQPDYGPTRAHPNLGVLVMGQREFLLEVAVNLSTEDFGVVKALAAIMRELRSEGDERFLGVRVLAMPLPSRSQTQLHLTLTMPDAVGIDPIVDWVRVESSKHGAVLAGCRLIGVIRHRDRARATHVRFEPDQIL